MNYSKLLSSSQLHLDYPKLSEVSDIFNLISSSKKLDNNSNYLYLLLCHHYSDTCSIAKINNKIVGFTSSYILPKRMDTLFIWQVVVNENFRNQGIALKMLIDILNREACKDIDHINVTVSPFNKPSRALFKALAIELGANIKEQTLFKKEHFIDNHDDENLLIISPLTNIKHRKK